ncbi:MAG: serine/threonine protein phosphatase [archaeon]|nr:serine/threonine protein phosphatase [archaeon]
MSSAQIASKAVKQLDPEDIIVLKGLEKTLTRFESIPIEALKRITKLDAGKIEFRLGRLNAFGFVMKSQFGYTLVSSGLDALALHSLVRRGLISGMGRSIGMGKESDVYEVISDAGEKAVIKFYRIGRISFRATRLKRSYSKPDAHNQWLEINIEAARKEEEGLVRALAAGVTTPKFIARDRHAVLMSEVEGLMLHRCRKEDIENPRELLKKILENTRTAYLKAKIINGDLSEYNILFDGEKPWIIDWPQYVNPDHPNASEILERDVENILGYFERKFGEKIDQRKALEYAKGEKKSL